MPENGKTRRAPLRKIPAKSDFPIFDERRPFVVQIPPFVGQKCNFACIAPLLKRPA